MLPSLSRYVVGSMKRLTMLFESSFNRYVFLATVACFIPRTVREILLPGFYKSFRNVVFEQKGTKYLILDFDSLMIVQPHFERYMDEILRINDGDVLVDVGAHIGKYPLKYRDKAGLIVAIEASPVVFRYLKANLALNNVKNVIAVQKAAWSEKGNLEFFESSSSGGGSLKIKHDSNSFMVEADTLDNILSELGISRVDWIKIDVEGAEYEVLKGAANTLKKHRPRVVAEVWRHPKENKSRILGFMKSLGYSWHRLTNDELFEYILFMPPRLRKGTGGA